MIYAHITEQYTYNRQAYIQRIYSVNTSIYIYQVTVETYQYNTICKYNEQTTPCKNVNLWKLQSLQESVMMSKPKHGNAFVTSKRTKVNENCWILQHLVTKLIHTTCCTWIFYCTCKGILLLLLLLLLEPQQQQQQLLLLLLLLLLVLLLLLLLLLLAVVLGGKRGGGGRAAQGTVCIDEEQTIAYLQHHIILSARKFIQK